MSTKENTIKIKIGQIWISKADVDEYHENPNNSIEFLKKQEYSSYEMLSIKANDDNSLFYEFRNIKNIDSGNDYRNWDESRHKDFQGILNKNYHLIKDVKEVKIKPKKLSI